MASIQIAAESLRAFFRSKIQSGAVFYRRDDKIRTREPHYFVVINADPASDLLLILTCAQTDIEGRLYRCEIQGFPVETIVVMTPDELECLSHDSVFDCNSYFQRTRQQLEDEYVAGDLQYVDVLSSPDLLNKLRQGVSMSPQVPDQIRDLVSTWII